MFSQPLRPLCPILGPRSEGIIEIRTSFGDRTKSFWAIYVENPYVQLEPEPGIMTQLPTHVRVSNVLRFQK